MFQNQHWYPLGAQICFIAVIAVDLFRVRLDVFEEVFNKIHWLRHPLSDKLQFLEIFTDILLVIVWQLQRTIQATFWPASIAYWIYRSYKDYKKSERPSAEVRSIYDVAA